MTSVPWAGPREGPNNPSPFHLNKNWCQGKNSCHSLEVTVRKNATHKESPQEKSHVQEQGLMAGSNCQAGWGKMAQHRLQARRGFYRRGRLRKLAHVWESLVGMELALECGNFCLRVGLSLGMAPFLK
jgi:hypothetical protein